MRIKYSEYEASHSRRSCEFVINLCFPSCLPLFLFITSIYYGLLYCVPVFGEHCTFFGYHLADLPQPQIENGVLRSLTQSCDSSLELQHSPCGTTIPITMRIMVDRHLLRRWIPHRAVDNNIDTFYF